MLARQLCGLILALLLPCLPGCAFADYFSVNERFVRHMDAVHKAVSPEYLDYVAADPALTDDQKQTRRDTVHIWTRSISEVQK